MSKQNNTGVTVESITALMKAQGKKDEYIHRTLVGMGLVQGSVKERRTEPYLSDDKKKIKVPLALFSAHTKGQPKSFEVADIEAMRLALKWYDSQKA